MYRSIRSLWCKSSWAGLSIRSALFDSEKAGYAHPSAANDYGLDRDDTDRRRGLDLPAILIIPSLIANLLVVLYLGFRPPTAPLLELDAICARHGAVHRSPLDEHIPVRYHTVRFNSSFSGHGSIYAAPPSEEVDNAWFELGVRANHFALPEYIDPTPYGIQPWQVKRDPDLGGGYIVYVEALHQLHCLNMLRKTSYWDYNYYNSGGGAPKVLEGLNRESAKRRSHSYHCIEMLRERIQCSADRAVFGEAWIENKEGTGYNAAPQYSTERKCQDFEALSKWVTSNTIHVSARTPKFREGDQVLAHDSGDF